MVANDELMSTLRAFYEETIRPEFDRSRGELRQTEGRLRFELHETRDQLQGELREEMGSLRREISGHFDAVYHRLDRLETEYHMLVVAVKRFEESPEEGKPAREILQAEVADLRTRVQELAGRVRELEARLASEPDHS